MSPRTSRLGILLTVFLAAATLASSQSNEAVTVQGIAISFKLDPRLSGGTYGGEQWVSPRTFTSPVQGGREATVEARVEVTDARGKDTGLKARWIAAEPDMVVVEPRGKEVYAITVKRAGESQLDLQAREVTLHLTLKAKRVGEGLQVDIVQAPLERPVAPAVAVLAGGAVEPSPLADDAAKNSYALGLATGRKLKGQFPGLQADLVSRGIADALAGSEPLASDDEIRAALARLGAEAMTARVKARKVLADKNKADGDAFLAANKAKPGVVTLPSGVQYSIVKAGAGSKPGPADTVVCNYRGRLVDGTEFDSSYSRGKPATFALGRVIAGWKEALPLMPAGSQWQIVVPSALAYGARGGGRIGPNATLVFDVELLSIDERKAAASSVAGSPQAGGVKPAMP
jgi:FKBP-type peptidyl-prolyl cis-trans isomerase